MIGLHFDFTSELWLSYGPGAWYFLTLPKEVSDRIKFFCEDHYGFGQIAVKATIGNTEWNTSIFPDKASGSFLLPIKSAIRKKEQLLLSNQVKVNISICINIH
jgi:hypothetical protein